MMMMENRKCEEAIPGTTRGPEGSESTGLGRLKGANFRGILKQSTGVLRNTGVSTYNILVCCLLPQKVAYRVGGEHGEGRVGGL